MLFTLPSLLQRRVGGVAFLFPARLTGIYSKSQLIIKVDSSHYLVYIIFDNRVHILYYIYCNWGGRKECWSRPLRQVNNDNRGNAPKWEWRPVQGETEELANLRAIP